MPSSTRDKDATRIGLGEAKALLAKRYGGSRLAEKLLRDEGAAGRLPWGYVRKNGAAADDGFWRYARIDFEENSACVGYTLFFVGPGVGPDGGTRSTEYLGIWVSRARVLTLLPPTDAEVPPPSASAPADAPAPRRPSDAAVEKCFRDIMDERTDDPPNEEWLLTEMKNRLKAPPGRPRVRKLWRDIAPQWRPPRGHPRNFNSAV